MKQHTKTLTGLYYTAAIFILGGASPLGENFHPVSCTALASMDWGNFTIDKVEERAARGAHPAHCMVRGTIDAEIQFELLLPLPEEWNGRFVMGGGGGFVGTVENQAMDSRYAMSGRFETPLQQGFATVGTDTGHRGISIDASWALHREDREINFGHRAVHVTAETAKTIIRIHYGHDIAYSYFLGCSRGGGQAMISSQRYPDDFNGIIGGAPAYNWPALGAQFLQTQQAMYPDPQDLSEPVVTADVRRLLARAILDACDDLDGLSDDILNDPRQCHFRPEDLARCPDETGRSGCVTLQQVRAIQTVYGGARVGDVLVYPGFPFGGEVDIGGWDRWITGTANAFGRGTPSLHYAFGTQMYKYLVFDDPDWDYASYTFSNWHDETRPVADILNGTETDLTPFQLAGGKLILWTGWSDPAITALGTVQYYEDVQKTHTDADSFTRLFLLPGVLHCEGGPGPDQVDWLDAIQQWVEHGDAPDRLPATKWGANGQVEMQRPVCRYPEVAEYDGSGDPKREESFECVAP